MSFLKKLFFGDYKKREEERRKAVAKQARAEKELLQAEKELLQKEYAKNFPFLDNLEYVFAFSAQGVVCECCEKTTKLYSEMGIQSEEECDILCPDCIASGRAAERFRGSFNELEAECESPEYAQTVESKTPCLPANQDYLWKVCCGEPCIYLKRATHEDVEKLSLWEALKETYCDEIIPFSDLQEMLGEEEDDSLLMLFRCKRCGKIHAIIDLD